MFEEAHEALTLVCAELEEIKCMRILGVTFTSKIKFETHLRKVVSKAARGLGGSHVCSRAVSVIMHCPAWSTVPTCGCRLPSLIWVC